jgi:hypothetical protein
VSGRGATPVLRPPVRPHRLGGRLASCATTPRHREALLNVVEGYVMGGIQLKVLDGISRTLEVDDANFAKRLGLIERLPPRALGVHPSHLKVGPAGYRSPPHTMPANSRDDGSLCVG